MASGMCSWRATQVGLGVGLVALAVAGCATRGFDRTTQIADSMAKQTAEMQAAKPQVDAMLASLDSLVRRAEGDMKPAFKRFSDTLDDTENVSNDLTQAGVKRLEPTIQKARQAGTGLQKALDDFNQVSQRVQPALRPAR